MQIILGTSPFRDNSGANRYKQPSGCDIRNITCEIMLILRLLRVVVNCAVFVHFLNCVVNFSCYSNCSVHTRRAFINNICDVSFVLLKALPYDYKSLFGLMMCALLF